MKKIALALIALVAVLSPLAAGESWIGVTTGPSFNIEKQKGSDQFTNYGMDVNIEGTYYFNEAETLGIGAKLGFGFHFDSTMDITSPFGKFDNPTAGFAIAPAVTFQYRLGLTDNLDLRLGAGAQYVHVFSQGASYSMHGAEVINTEYATDRLELITNADLAYSFGDFQIIAGVDFGYAVLYHYNAAQTIQGTKTTDSDFYEGYAMSITPRVGVSYAF